MLEHGWASLLLVCCSGCGVNPAYDEPSQSGGGSQGTTLAGSSTAQDSTGTSSPTGSGTAGEGVTTTSGETADTTGPLPGVCGDGLLDRGEACDDGNEANDDGCVSCVSPRSCAEILALAPMSPSGLYKVDPGASGEPWPVTCDMDKDGGGWTGFSVQDTCNGHLDSTVVALEPAENAGVDGDCRAFSEKVSAGAFAYHWDISFPPGFRAFFLRGYEVQGLGDAELKYPQVVSVPVNDFETRRQLI